MKKNLIITGLGILLLFFLFLNFRQCSSKKDVINSYSALNDTLLIYQNKYGQEVAKIQIIETQRIKDFLKMKSQDSTILKLQKLVKEKNPQSALIINTITELHDTIQIYKTDTSIDFNFVDSWINLRGEIKDSLIFDLLVKNEYNIVYKKGYAELTNLNPYSSTSSFRVYERVERKKSFGIGANLGLFCGYDMINKSPVIGIGIGIGLNYDFISF